MSQIVSDNFTRADAATLGANWSLVGAGAYSNFSIVSNRANTLSSGVFDNYDVFTGASWTGGADQYAELTIQVNPANADGGPAARAWNTGGNDQSAYLANMNNNDAVALGSAMHFDLFEVSTSNVFTAVTTGLTAQVVAAGDVLRVEAQGTTIRAVLNGVTKLSGTNSAHAAGKPGMRWFAPTANGTKISLFAAGDFAASATSGLEWMQPRSQPTGHYRPDVESV